MSEQPSPQGMRRRDLLIRAGVLGAAAAVGGFWPVRAAAADVPEALEPLLEMVSQPALDLLTRDTYSGLAVFAVPIVGPIAGSPFTNLSHAEKAQACQRIEQAYPELVELIDAHAPEPLRKIASGLLRYAGGFMLTLSTYSAYTEFAVFDHKDRRVTRRPVGWDLSRYMPGRTTPADGWAEFRGYYHERCPESSPTAPDQIATPTTCCTDFPLDTAN